jgi:DNA-binding beta-propeller fold protein YncE
MPRLPLLVMQLGGKTISWILSTVAVIFMFSMIICTPHKSISQEYRFDNMELINSYYIPGSDYSIFPASSTGNDDDEDDDGENEQNTGAGDTTEICNRYLEVCDGEGATSSPGTSGTDCNKLFESCPSTPTPTPSPTISPSPTPTTPTPTPTPTPLPSPAPPTATETSTRAALTNTTVGGRLPSDSVSLTCPPIGNSSEAASLNTPASSGGNYTFLRKFIVEFNPAGLGLDDPSGNVYVSDYSENRIQKLSSNGTVLTTWGGESQFNNPEGISVDPCTREVLVADTDNHRIQKFDSNGTFITRWGSQGSADGQFNHPYGVATDSSGNVLVSDFDNHRIQKFDSNGTFITSWGSQGSADGQFNHPYGVATDSSGNVLVSDFDNHRVQKFDSNGTFITSWGSQGSADGQLNKPDGISIDNDSQDVYVSDGGNSRIQVFSNNVE